MERLVVKPGKRAGRERLKLKTGSQRVWRLSQKKMGWEEH